MVDSFEVKRRVKEFIRENKMLEEGDGVLAAVSGGADSVCLLLVLNELKELDVSTLTPLDALNTIYRLQNKLKNRW